MHTRYIRPLPLCVRMPIVLASWVLPPREAALREKPAARLTAEPVNVGFRWLFCNRRSARGLLSALVRRLRFEEALMLVLRSHSAPENTRRSTIFCHPSFESLEGRLLMAGLDVPQFSSRPGAAATIYLDFDGHTQASWGTFSNITSPVFDRDNDLTSFSATELQTINDIWTRVSEDFAPFNVNVTTVEPPSFADGVALRVVIGRGW